jgi:predicted amidohydrolase
MGLILSQEPWSAADAAGAGRIAAAAAAEARKREFGVPDWTLVLFPQAEDMAAEAAFMDAMGKVAAAQGIYLAGSARLAPDVAAVPATVGFIFSPDGVLLLRTGKITPDLIEGFVDGTTLPAAEADFPVVKLPFAQVGMLLGEDILFAQYARSLVYHGAELILNPCVERSDRMIEPRTFSRWGRAVDSAGFVAVASPRSITVEGVSIALPTVTALYSWERSVAAARGGESFVFPDFDIQALRRKRVMPTLTFPAIVRANAFGANYARWAEEDAAAAAGAKAPVTRDDWLAEASRRLAAEQARVGPKLAKYEEQYDVLAVQATGHHIPLGSPDTRELMMRTIDDTFAYVAGRAGGKSVRLLVFPEFWIGGSGGGGKGQRTVRDLEPMAISHGDEVFEKIGTFAQKHGVYIAFQSFELHEKLPHRVFNSAFLINDSGDLINTYRKQQCADIWGGLPVSVPGSIFDQYLDAFGYEGLFPVVDTPLGMLANMICFEVSIPEVASGLRRMGAEVILHSTAEGHSTEGRAAWDNGRFLRAADNGAYMVTANNGGRFGATEAVNTIWPNRGKTRFINYDGTQMGIAEGPGQIALLGSIDLAALRRFRADPRLNMFAWNDPAAYAGVYNGDVGVKNNLWAGDWLDNPYVASKVLNETINDYLDKGIYVEPETISAVADRSGPVLVRNR